MNSNYEIVLRVLKKGIPVRLFPGVDEVYLDESNQLCVKTTCYDLSSKTSSEKFLVVDCALSQFLNACERIEPEYLTKLKREANWSSVEL